MTISEENESLSWQNFENGCQELAKKIKDSGIVYEKEEILSLAFNPLEPNSKFPNILLSDLI